MKKYDWINIYNKKILLGNDYPWSDVITNISKFKLDKKLNFIEVGCGTGSNGLFVSRKHNYTGIDISNKIINKGKKKFSKIKNFILRESNLNNFNFDKKYDFLLDRFCLTHNSFKSSKKFINKFENHSNGKKFYLGFFFKEKKKKKFIKLNSKIKIFTNFYNKKKIISLFSKKIKIIVYKDIKIYSMGNEENSYIIFGCKIG